MKKIVFLGDSITDMARDRKLEILPYAMGTGYVFFLDSYLREKYPDEYEVYNKGISGNRTVDLYARIKSDVWNLNPDVLSILIGTNDVWHELPPGNNGVEIDRYEVTLKNIISETQARFPNIKIILMGCFVLDGSATTENWETLKKIKEYAKVSEKIARERGVTFIPLQSEFDEMSKKYGSTALLYDGVHPTSLGSKIIAENWIKYFEK